MPKQFQYTNKKLMPPRPGVKYATEYYQQPHGEYELLKQHIVKAADEIVDCLSHTETAQWLTTPNRQYRKTKGPNYTPLEIVMDMVKQFKEHKDVPSGMLGRWHKLFKNTRWDFELVPHPVDRSTNTYNNLFK